MPGGPCNFGLIGQHQTSLPQAQIPVLPKLPGWRQLSCYCMARYLLQMLVFVCGAQQPRVWFRLGFPLRCATPLKIRTPALICRAEHPEAHQGWLRDQEAHKNSLAGARPPCSGGQVEGPPLRLRCTLGQWLCAGTFAISVVHLDSFDFVRCIKIRSSDELIYRRDLQSSAVPKYSGLGHWVSIRLICYMQF